jgi:hypothetical protein
VEDNRLLALPNEFPRFTCGKQSFFSPNVSGANVRIFFETCGIILVELLLYFITTALRNLCDNKGTKHPNRLEMSFFVFLGQRLYYGLCFSSAIVRQYTTMC